MMRLFFAGLLAILALSALEGCASAPGVPPPQDTTKFTVENTDRFLSLDADTEASVGCTGLQERTLEDGRIGVVANLRNSSDRALKLQVQCVFLDDGGMPVASDSAWQTVPIKAGATEVVRFTAPSSKARRYSIRARISP
jgi:uncharacterized protein YcfL